MSLTPGSNCVRMEFAIPGGSPVPAMPVVGGQIISDQAMTRVAIVEDNATVRQTLTRWIDEAKGLSCVCACSTGEEALDKLPRLMPDVVLMDIQLPNRSGIECTARLRQILPASFAMRRYAASFLRGTGRTYPST